MLCILRTRPVTGACLFLFEDRSVWNSRITPSLCLMLSGVSGRGQGRSLLHGWGIRSELESATWDIVVEGETVDVGVCDVHWAV